MEHGIGYVIMLCTGTAARSARLKYNNCGLAMMLFTNSYENHSRVCRVTYIYVRSRAKYLKFRTTTSKINTLGDATKVLFYT